MLNQKKKHDKRPPVFYKRNYVPKLILLRPSTFEWLIETAKKYDLTINEIIRGFIEQKETADRAEEIAKGRITK